MWSESFLLSLKWFMITLGVVIGTSAFIISQKLDSMDPVIIGIVGYGSSYIMMALWKDFREKLLFASGVVFVGLSLAAPYFEYVLFVVFNYNEEMNPYVLWALSMLFPGIPIMTVVLRIVNR